MDLAILALIEEQGTLNQLFGDFSYLAPFVILLLCGIGLPLPEEVSLIGAGLLLHKGEVEFLPIVLVCSSAILLGDSIPFLLGKKYGAKALDKPWVRRRFHPRRFKRLKERFDEHGTWATFSFRFFPGARIPGYFVAGTMGMSTLRFLLLDGLGVLLTVPISIWVGKLFANQIDRLKATMHDLHLILAFIALSLVLILAIRGWRQSKAKLARRKGLGDDPPGEALDMLARSDDSGEPTKSGGGAETSEPGESTSDFGAGLEKESGSGPGA